MLGKLFNRTLRWPALRSFLRRSQTGKIECRIATDSDTLGIAALMEPLFPLAARDEAKPAAERLLHETNRCGGEYHIALLKGRIAGGCQAGPLLKSAGFEGWWAMGLWVPPGCRGKGVGQMLVESVVESAKRRGETRLYCHIAETNLASLGLFRKLGFRDAPEEIRRRIEERFSDAFDGACRVQALCLDLLPADSLDRSQKDCDTDGF